MKNTRLLIQLPPVLMQKLQELRTQGYTASGYIRALLQRELNQSVGTVTKRRGR